MKLGAGTVRHKASSVLAVGSGRARREHVQQQPRGRGAGGREVAGGQGPRRRVTRFPGPANWEKWLTKLKNLFWLTWWSLGITAHTSSAVPEIHSVSTGSQFTVENLCKRISPAILGTGVSSAAAVIHY